MLEQGGRTDDFVPVNVRPYGTFARHEAWESAVATPTRRPCSAPRSGCKRRRTNVAAAALRDQPDCRAIPRPRLPEAPGPPEGATIEWWQVYHRLDLFRPAGRNKASRKKEIMRKGQIKRMFTRSGLPGWRGTGTTHPRRRSVTLPLDRRNFWTATSNFGGRKPWRKKLLKNSG